MPLAPGTRLGVYEIVSTLGAGGMGVVYRARDTKLHRDVAIKVLPDPLAGDSDRLTRFRREAHTLAALNHPNIAHIHGFEESGEVHALVMELVEGENLSQRIARGATPLDEALPIAKQIADALEAAHEHGIIHRDLKPANIRVRPDGMVKVLDFGLAKAVDASAASSAQAAIEHSPTITSPAAMTAAGVLLGTAAYMSPEQARGKPVDRRADIWAFGCVLYELLTGRPCFAGPSVTDVLAAVVREEPDWNGLPKETPSRILVLLRRCLRKDAKQRLHDIADARLEIDEAMTDKNADAPVLHVRNRSISMIAGCVVCLVFGGVIGWLGTRSLPQTPTVTNLQLVVKPADQLSGSRVTARPSRTAFALSPDGRQIVFSANLASATQPTSAQLYLRSLDQPAAKLIPGTEGGLGPFFSPDGQWIGFYSKRQIKKVPVSGGPPVVICDVPRLAIDNAMFGATWTTDGAIFFSDRGDGIQRVSAGGGSPVTVTTSDAAKGERHLLPQVLPGGKAIIFTVVTSLDWEKAQIVAQSLETGQHRVLVEGGQDGRYIHTGHLAYLKLGTLMAVPFDPGTLNIVGDPVALIDNVMQGVNLPNTDDETGQGQFTVSDSGTLAYLPGGIHPLGLSRPVWVDRKGTATPIPSAPVQNYWSVRFSPDGERVAMSITDSRRAADLWVIDNARGVTTRITAKGYYNWPALWSPDGRQLAFGSDQSGVMNLHLINADGSGELRRLTTSPDEQAPSSWTARGNMIAFLERKPPNKQIWVVSVDGEQKPKLFLESAFDLTYPEFSPDGRWIAYVSTESTPAALFVQPFPGPGAKHRISIEGAQEPAWAANGRELLYRNDSKFYSVPIANLNPFRAEAPRLLFETKPMEYARTDWVRSWDVTRDGQRFLLLKSGSSNDKPITDIEIVLNWTEELKRLAPSNR